MSERRRQKEIRILEDHAVGRQQLGRPSYASSDQLTGSVVYYSQRRSKGVLELDGIKMYRMVVG